MKSAFIHLLQVTASDCPFYQKHKSLHKEGWPHSGQVPSLCVCTTHKCDLFFRMFEKAFSGKPFWRFNGAILKSWPLSCCRTSHLSILAVLWWLLADLEFMAWPSQSNFFYFPFIITCVCGCNVQQKISSVGRNIQIVY